MTLTFEHKGQTHTLTKHATVRQALRTGTITEAEARLRPWYLRPSWSASKPFKLCVTDADAIRAAKDILRGRTERPDQFSAWLEERENRRGVTIGTLAKAWFDAGLPFSGLKPRSTPAAERLRETVTRALSYWQDIQARKAPEHFQTFAANRMANARSGTGRRTADLQLSALSCLCAWAVAEKRLDQNPFDTELFPREPFVISEDIQHCHEFMPDNDEQFNDLLAHMFAGDQRSIIAGAWLCFGALTGLRPHEPSYLLRVPAATEFPASLKTAPEGLIYPMPNGTHRMKVRRGKGGQNPAIEIHPTLADFMAHWTQWLDTHIPPSTFDLRPSTQPLFPCKQDDLADSLRAAAKAIGAREQHPHGFMRAYYVRVRKSQGADPATVAAELGQTSGGSLIRSVYGDPNDPVGGNLFDWQPKHGAAAWVALTAALPQNIITPLYATQP